MTSHRSHRSHRLLQTASVRALIIGVALAAVPAAGFAQTWTGAFNDDYNDGRNWSTGTVPPTSGTVVTINTTTNAPVVDGVAASASSGIVVGDGGAGAGQLTIRNGARLIGIGQTNIGGSSSGVAGGNGTVLVTGAGSLLQNTNQIIVGLTRNARGTLTIDNGGTVRGNAGLFGVGEGSVATVTVRGANSLLDLTGGLLSLGSNNVDAGRATLNVLAGGRVTGGNGTTNFVNAVSAINISGANSLLTSGAGLTINGALLIEDGGWLNYAQGITLGGATTMRNGTMSVPVVGSSGGLGLVAGGTLVADASTIAVGSNFSIAGAATLRGTTVTAAAINISQNGVLNIGGADGAAAGAPGTITTPSITVSEPNSRLVFNHSGTDLVLNAAIRGNGRVLHLAGTTVLTTAPYSGGVTGINVTGGSLFVDGRVTATTLTLGNGATLGGTGTLNGSVAVTNGTITPGNRGVGTLTVGNLSLTAASILNFELGAPGTPGIGSDLIKIGNIDNIGNLTLDGTLNVASVGGFGAGLYRLIDYSGTLTNNVLNVGTTPTGFAASNLTVQTSVARQVNLLVGVAATPGIFNFWDGANTASNNLVDGGTGTWTAAGGNWTLATGATNGAYDPTKLLIFSGAAGTVTVDSTTTPITIANGMQFATNGYSLTGGALQLVTPTSSFVFGSTIRVGDGTAAGAAITANIATALTGPSGMDKTDLGTLRLTGANTYLGETRVLAGNLAVAGGTLGGTEATSALRVASPGTTASVAVTAGAVLTSTAASVGIETGSNGTVTVSGAGSRWNVVGGGGVRIGNAASPTSRGLVEILDGGVLNYNAAFSFAPLSVERGSAVRVSGVGSRLDATAIMLFNQGGGGGQLLLENGGVARAQNFEFGGTSALLTIRSGARLEATTTTSLPFTQGAQAVITGQGSQLALSGPLSINVGSGIVVEDRAVVRIDNNVDSGLGFQGALATLNVNSGASFILAGGAQAGLQTENARLTVDNAVFSIGGGLTAGQRFGNTTIVLRNADFTASSVSLRAADDRMVIGADIGEVAGAAGRFNVAGAFRLGNVATTLVLNHNSAGFTIGSDFQGAGIIRHIAGDTRLTSTTTQWNGSTLLTGGGLAIDGLFGNSQSNTAIVTVSGGAVLSGRGTVGGTVTIADGTIRPGGDALNATGPLLGGNAVGTLTIDGPLLLGAASRLAFQLGAPNTPGVGSDLINVSGNLTLDGTVDITNAGGFGAGLYRLINYGGTLTNNVLNIGAVPGGFSATDLTVQTSVARQVNLIVGAPPPAFTSFSFWDGPSTTANRAIDGGTGIWTTTGRNWTVTTGEANGVYDPTQLLIFAGTGGVATVDTTPGAVVIGRGLRWAATA